MTTKGREITITEAEFVEKYKPERTANGDTHLRDWFSDEDKKAIQVGIDENRLWTMIDGDNGTCPYVSGYHYVNRMHYLLTEVPYDPNDFITVDDD
jgi:hypothetical protein